MNRETLKLFLKEQGLRPLKSLGQNFLVHPGLIQEIVRAIKQNPAPYVEIGPGAGALTRHFDKKELILVEKDKKLAQYWKNQAWKVFEQDALKLKREQLPPSFTLFGNLPYEIAGSLIIKMSACPKAPKNAVFLIQKEVADRMKARPKSKNYSLLTVIVQNFWSFRELFFVSKQHFYPQPKVDGSLIQLKSRPLAGDLGQDFLPFVKKSFHNRRKMLFKKLPDKQNPKKKLENLGFSPHCRAEDLSPEDFLKLFQSLSSGA